MVRILILRRRQYGRLRVVERATNERQWWIIAWREDDDGSFVLRNVGYELFTSLAFDVRPLDGNGMVYKANFAS